MSREEAIRLVQRLMDSTYADEAECDAMIAALERGTGCPHISDYVFWGLRSRADSRQDR
ncbi:hypothetical protein GCM10010377_36520 [Streptomyces viridiviolaceus]|uniref:E9imm peptide n=1 Tax=Streptomyces viridiviolaceus TaxID=68282 RepID=A0ABW2E8K9_9ACTN|nr:hypothetical protein [Streptomyces viridiviolaceus]GHB42362.1 hypothetical protein GCM10010377_36520 [Streptomyces viridiviolaceus]